MRAVLGEKATTVAVALAFGLAVAMLPVLMFLDEQMDRKRPMYDDVHAVHVLEYEQMKQTGRGTAVMLRDDERATIGGRSFSPSRGTTIEVRLTDDGYCIQGRNRHGDVTQWRCGDGRQNPDLD
jgi:hypothetical protein